MSAFAKAIEQDSIAMQELIQKNRLDEAHKTLPPSDLEVFDLLAKGYDNKELVNTIGISLSTVIEHNQRGCISCACTL